MFALARDRFATTVEQKQADAARRGMPIPTAESLLPQDRALAAFEAYPALTEKIKELVKDGKIPTSVGGRDFSFKVVNDIQSSMPTGRTADDILRASLRAIADLRLFFEATALPVVESPDRFPEELDKLVPSAAAAYRQAVADLRADRLSYRGPANELRQALWDVLHTLAPDGEVLKDTNYKSEPGAKSPTQRQRATFIMRKRRGQGPSDSTLTAIDAVATLTRDIYTRSNSSTHSAKDREEALQVQRYVEAVLRDLLA
jgi:predicted pPIWI-associating nuclease